MGSRFVVRLIDLTLLLLLSLLAVVRLTDYAVTLPTSQEMQDEGTVPWPLEAAVDAAGAIMVIGEGVPIPVTAEELAAIAAQSDRPVELRVDQHAQAQRLMDIHAILQARQRPATFLVEYRADP